MKKVLLFVIALIVGLGFSGLSAPFSGSWVMDVTVTTPQTPTFTLTSVLTVNYTISGWTFGSVSRFSVAGWYQQDFSADGAIDRFRFTNNLRFVPTTPAFTWLRSTVAVPVAGVDLAGRFLIVEDGSGFRAGFSAPIDDLRFAAIAFFGSFAFDTDWGLVPVADRSHIPEFRGLDVDITMPFYSTTLTIDVDFTRAYGFQDITFDVPAFELGIPQFTLDLRVVATLAKQTVTITPAIAIVDWIHFRPVVSLDWTQPVIKGLRLRGLHLMWAVTDTVRFRYHWDAPGSQMVELRYKAAPLTLTMAGTWVWDPVAIPMFPDRVDIDLAIVDVLPRFAVRAGADFRDTAFYAVTFGFTVSW